jgi:ribonuclease E
MRVHALAKLIGVTSREILAALTGLGHEARSVQSSIERKIVEQIVGAVPKHQITSILDNVLAA